MFEIRTFDISKLDQICGFCERYDMTMGVGSESCVYKLMPPDILVDLASSFTDLAIVTPITPQKHFDRIFDYIQGLPDGIRLIVNDVGVLYWLYNNVDVDRFSHVIAGRGIVHTSEACPWVDHLLRDETPMIKEAFLGTNLNYTRTLDFFKNMGITGMECDLEYRTVAAAIRTGFPVSAHAEFTAVSYARSCHTARFYHEVPPTCTARCHSHIELELVDMFDLAGTPPGFAQPGPEMLEMFPTLYLLGNTVLMKNRCKNIKGLDRVIFNADMYTPGTLDNAVFSFFDG